MHSICTCISYIFPPPRTLNPLGAPSSSSSFRSPSTTAFSADSEHSTESAETEEGTATEMEVEPAEPTSELPAAAAAMATALGESGGSVDGEHQVDPEEERPLQQQHASREDSGISQSDRGFSSLSEPGE